MSRPCSVLLAALALACVAAPAAGQTVTGRNLTLMAHFNDYPPGGGWAYSACWSYVHHDGREYAVLGVDEGTAIYNVTNPASSYFVGFIPGKVSTWREMKSYRNWIYVVTESADPNNTQPLVARGMQIIDMTNPEQPVLAATYATHFQTAHTVSIDTTRALLICNGTRSWSGFQGLAAGMRILSLANPVAPVQVSWWPGGSLPVASQFYIHDSVPIGNRLYASSITTPGYQRIFDFSNPASPVEISSWTYPGAFTHNAWPDSSGTALYVTDELNGQPLKIFDISNVHAPALVNTITSNPAAIVHNAHVRGRELYLSNYTEGVRILDLSDPFHPAEFAWADSWSGASGGFNSVWEVCPYFPSGTVIASDMNTGLYVYRPVRNYGIVRVRVVSQSTGSPVAGASVHLITQGDLLTTPADGVVQFGPSPGNHSVHVHKFGYTSPVHSRTVTTGSRDTVVIAIPAVDLAGTIRQAGTLAPLAEAEVELDQPAIAFTDGAGAYELPGIPEDTYTVSARAPGHVTASVQATLEASDPSADFVLRPAATWIDFESAGPWTVGAPGDNAVRGIWTRVDPLGTGNVEPPPGGLRARPGPAVPEWTPPVLRPDHEEHPETPTMAGSVQPEYDRTPAPGTRCWVTGQGDNPFSTSQADVDSGRTSLTSPAFDLSAMKEPTIAYWRWFYGQNSGDWLTVLISNDNGATFVPVDTTRGIVNSWEERIIRVADHVTPTAQVRVRFVAADLGTDHLVEAAIDDVALYDAAIPQIGIPGTGIVTRFAFRPPRPNPTRGAVALALEVPVAGRLEVDVHDLAGRHVRALHRGATAPGVVALAWDGATAAGRPAGAGVYFVRARLAGRTVQARIVRVP